jgi:Protein of unknown function (DUF3025)
MGVILNHSKQMPSIELTKPPHEAPGGVLSWQMPWLDPVRGVGQAIAQVWQAGTPLHEALNQGGGAAVRFVPQASLPPDQAYEDYIFRTGNCPTRDGLHDFFNGLCWIHFPATKKRLNQLQAAQIDRDGIKGVRGALRDAVTVFDENAAFLQAPQPLWDALLAKDWKTLFGVQRAMWADTHLVLFGHALQEKLAAPRKPITAHVYRVDPATRSLADLDAWVAADLNADKLAKKPFSHLPVLGVPGWWPANEDAGFYEDTSVFRPLRDNQNTPRQSP